MTGTVTSLRPGGFGFIASDGHGLPWHLIFRRGAVADDGFERLREGQRVRFDRVPVPGNPGRRCAVDIAPLVAEGARPPSATA